MHCVVKIEWHSSAFLSISVLCVHFHHFIFIWLMQNQTRGVRLRNSKLNEHWAQYMQSMDRCWYKFLQKNVAIDTHSGNSSSSSGGGGNSNRNTSTSTVAQHPLTNSTNAHVSKYMKSLVIKTLPTWRMGSSIFLTHTHTHTNTHNVNVIRITTNMREPKRDRERAVCLIILIQQPAMYTNKYKRINK